MTLWLSDSVTLWLCDSVTQWLCDSVTLWLSDSVTQWLSDSVTPLNLSKNFYKLKRLSWQTRNSGRVDPPWSSIFCNSILGKARFAAMYPNTRRKANVRNVSFAITFGGIKYHRFRQFTFNHTHKSKLKTVCRFKHQIDELTLVYPGYTLISASGINFKRPGLRSLLEVID